MSHAQLQFYWCSNIPCNGVLQEFNSMAYLLSWRVKMKSINFCNILIMYDPVWKTTKEGTLELQELPSSLVFIFHLFWFNTWTLICVHASRIASMSRLFRQSCSTLHIILFSFIEMLWNSIIFIYFNTHTIQ